MPEGIELVRPTEKDEITRDFLLEYRKALLLALREKDLLEEEVLRRCFRELENGTFG